MTNKAQCNFFLTQN